MNVNIQFLLYLRHPYLSIAIFTEFPCQTHISPLAMGLKSIDKTHAKWYTRLRE